MKPLDIFIAHPKTIEEVNALKSILKALKIKFEITIESPYNSEFVEKIKASKQQIIEGKYTEVKRKDLNSFIDNL